VTAAFGCAYSKEPQEKKAMAIPSRRLPRWFVAIVVLGTVGRLGAQPKSEEEWKQLAEKGSAGAKFLLATAYDSEGPLNSRWGISVSKNDSEAARWYSKAASQGDIASMVILAEMYFEGRGVEKSQDSQDKRIQLLWRAGRRGHTGAMSILSGDYSVGMNGLPRDIVTAYALSDVTIRENRCEVTNRSKEIEEAQAAASVNAADSAVPDSVLKSPLELRDKWLEVRKERIEELKEDIEFKTKQLGSDRKILEADVSIRASMRRLHTESSLAAATKLADQMENDLRDSFHSACLAPETPGSVSGQHPQSTMSGSSETASMATERIRSSRYAPMPEPKALPDASGTTFTVENKTKLPISVYLNGSTSRALTVLPSSSASATITPGRYQIAAEIPNSGVTPFYGEQTFNAGTKYQQVFLMSEARR
jgi:hypothetical protein